MRFIQEYLLQSGSMTSAINSISVDSTRVYQGSLQAVWTGSPVGSLYVQVSNDIVPAQNLPSVPGTDPGINVVNWITYTGSSTAVSGPGNFMFILGFTGYRFFRLYYSPTSGTGSLTVTVFGQGI